MVLSDPVGPHPTPKESARELCAGKVWQEEGAPAGLDHLMELAKVGPPEGQLAEGQAVGGDTECPDIRWVPRDTA